MDEHPNAPWNKEQHVESVASITPFPHLEVLLASTRFSTLTQLHRITLIRRLENFVTQAFRVGIDQPDLLLVSLFFSLLITYNLTRLNQFNHG
ncbi:hypothetical protein GO730_07940 [Spirosoma sp. HMF3257]|uniref:hypothetical protein n=1 Tax=Spirosoma telluris TaxID=2183553 RepID=UPI0011B94018|nr:hypothetical protein [Spirosoma telluris]